MFLHNPLTNNYLTQQIVLGDRFPSGGIAVAGRKGRVRARRRVSRRALPPTSWPDGSSPPSDPTLATRRKLTLPLQL